MAREDLFDGLASGYAASRPRYPDSLAVTLRAFTVNHMPDVLSSGALLDVGSGTGIATRILRRTFGPRPLVAGVEPSGSMLAQAMQTTDPLLAINWIRGAAEALPIADANAHLVVAAQAVQWFDRPAFHAEAARVLRAGGVVAVLQNNRDWAHSEFLEEYEGLLESLSPGYTRRNRNFDVRAEWAAVAAFAEPVKATEHWVRMMTADAFVTMAWSSTKVRVAVACHGVERVCRRVRQLVARHCDATGQVAVQYEAELFMATRRR